MMTPLYLNSQPQSPIPFIDLNKDNNQQQNIQVFGYLHGGDHLSNTTSNSSSFSYNPNNTLHSTEMFPLDYTRHDQLKIEKLVLSSDQDQQCSSWLQSRVMGEDSRSNSYTNSMNMEEKKEKNHNNNNDQNNKYSRKWKSSKVRIMQKMMINTKNSRDSSKQENDHDLPKRQTNDGIRVCTDCHTTTTPLWRSGPQGPKSLCNACGIRQRKARRAAMAAAAATSFSNDNPMVTFMSHVEAPKPKNHTLPLKKRSKIINASKNYNNNNNNNYYTHNNNSKKICFEDLALNSNKDNSMRSFPRDEEEGAILLMALSCGLACYSY